MLQNIEQPLLPCPQSLIYSCYPPTLSERSWNKMSGSSSYFPNQSPLSFLPAKGLCQRLVVAPVLGGPVLGGVCGVGVYWGLQGSLLRDSWFLFFPSFPTSENVEFMLQQQGMKVKVSSLQSAIYRGKFTCLARVLRVRSGDCSRAPQGGNY